MDAIISLAANRRAARRYSVAKTGQIMASAEDPPVRVSIHDMSAFGARLQVHSSQSVPREFSLLLVEEALVFRVMMRWRNGAFCGVQFFGEPAHVMA